MHDVIELVRLIKKTALDAVEAAKPVSVCFGKVVCADPIQVAVDQKMILGKAQLVLSRHVSEYETVMSGEDCRNFYHDGEEPNSEIKQTDHKHSLEQIKITVHNGLAAGDEVILLRQQGGQKYIIWDKLL